MAEARTRIASQKVDGSTITFTIYGSPHPESGIQPVTGNVTIDTSKFPATQQAMLAAVGFGRVCEGRWNRKDAATVGEIIANTTNEMTDGSWQPGRVFEEREPDDLTLALAEVQKVPVHVIQNEMDTRMKYVDALGNFTRERSGDIHLYKDAKGRPHKFYDKAMREELSEHPSVAPVLARLIRERAARMTAAARSAKTGPDLGGLFGTGNSQEAAE